jgi:hypothetical protein
LLLESVKNDALQNFGPDAQYIPVPQNPAAVALLVVLGIMFGFT